MRRGAALFILDGAESVALPERAVTAKQSQYDDEEHRYEEDCEDRSRQHATDHGTADRVLSASTSTRRDREGKHTDNECEAGHEDRAQPQLRSFDRRIEGVHPHTHALFGELDDEDRILGRHPDRRDKSDLQIDIVVLAGERRREQRADDAQRHYKHH